MLYMFRTVLVQLQEQLLQAVHRIWYMPVCADMCGCCVAIVTQQTDLWYRHIPAYTKCDVQLVKVAPDDGLI